MSRSNVQKTFAIPPFGYILCNGVLMKWDDYLAEEIVEEVQIMPPLERDNTEEYVVEKLEKAMEALEKERDEYECKVRNHYMKLMEQQVAKIKAIFNEQINRIHDFIKKQKSEWTSKGETSKKDSDNGQRIQNTLTLEAAAKIKKTSDKPQIPLSSCIYYKEYVTISNTNTNANINASANTNVNANTNGIAQLLLEWSNDDKAQSQSPSSNTSYTIQYPNEEGRESPILAHNNNSCYNNNTTHVFDELDDNDDNMMIMIYIIIIIYIYIYIYIIITINSFIIFPSFFFLKLLISCKGYPDEIEIQKSCLGCVGNLMNETSNAVAFLDKKGHLRIFEIMKGLVFEESVTSLCCRLLEFLAADSDTANTLMESGGCRAVARLLEDNINQSSLIALDEAVQMIAKEGIVELMVTISNEQDNWKNLEIMSEVIKVVGKCSGLEENAQLFAKGGSVALLKAIEIHHANAAFIGNAAIALSKLSVHPAASRSLVKRGAIAVIVESANVNAELKTVIARYLRTLSNFLYTEIKAGEEIARTNAYQVMQHIAETHSSFEPLTKEWTEFEQAIRLKANKIGQDSAKHYSVSIRDRIDKANLRLLTAGTVMRKHDDVRVDESCELLLFEDTNGKREPGRLDIKSIRHIQGGNSHPSMRNVPKGCGIQIVSTDPNGREIVVCLETETGIECDKWLSALQELVHAWSNDKEEEEKEEDKKEDKTEKQNKINKAIDEKEEKRKWMKWWKAKNEKDKSEIISKFEHLSKSDFGIWLLHQSKWKNDLTNENLSAICAVIEIYIDYNFIDNVLLFLFSKKEQTEKKQEDDGVDCVLFVIVFFYYYYFFYSNHNNKHNNMDETKKLIKMKELTFEELLHQAYICLESKAFQKINNENLKLQLVDMKNNIIESNEAVKKEFESNEPTFKIVWISFQQPAIFGKTKTIKNALVILIAISEYEDNNIWKNLKNVKEKDIKNFKQLFEQELNYEIVYNPSPKMTKEDIQDFMDQ
ncbi:hypothetical protein RFI_20668, partial [Reticulomyxa filosa]